MQVKAVSLAKKNPPIKLELYVDRESPAPILFINV